MEPYTDKPSKNHTDILPKQTLKTLWYLTPEASVQLHNVPKINLHGPYTENTLLQHRVPCSPLPISSIKILYHMILFAGSPSFSCIRWDNVLKMSDSIGTWKKNQYNSATVVEEIKDNITPVLSKIRREVEIIYLLLLLSNLW